VKDRGGSSEDHLDGSVGGSGADRNTRGGLGRWLPGSLDFLGTGSEGRRFGLFWSGSTFLCIWQSLSPYGPNRGERLVV
jgi:hypothetical protein